MSVERGGTDNDCQQTPLLGHEEEMDTRTHSESIQQLLSPVGETGQEIANMGRHQSQQDDEGIGLNNIDPNHNGTDRNKNQMMYVVLVSIMIVLVSVTFSQSLAPFMIPKYNNPSPTSEAILIAYMFVGLLIIGAMHLFKHVITEAGPSADWTHGARSTIKTILQDYLSIFGIRLSSSPSPAFSTSRISLLPPAVMKSGNFAEMSSTENI